jgi:hypothetical protein
MAYTRYPTPYSDVNAVLDGLLSGVKQILGPRFVGMYLGGSLATGDFDPLRSDIDFLVVTTEDLPEDVTPSSRSCMDGLRVVSRNGGRNLKAATFRSMLCAVTCLLKARIR